jgi:glycosidase
MRFWDNHDEDRAIARFGKRGALAASALVPTMDGVPLLYNGAEAGDATESGAPALFERLPVFWKIAERRPEFPRFYMLMIALRRAHPALRQGETRWLQNSDDSRIGTYLRRDSSEEFVIAINLSSRLFAGSVEVTGGESFKDVTPDTSEQRCIHFYLFLRSPVTIRSRSWWAGVSYQRQSVMAMYGALI